ncbi:MAG: L-2-amino-thiazoline-4-carboxylic acid hydrolase [Candidatus Heimdallarchaeota archaeon]
MEIFRIKGFDSQGTTKIDLVNHLNIRLRSANMFLEMLRNDHPNSIETVVQVLSKSLIDRAGEFVSDLELNEQYSELEKFPNLILQIKSAVLALLNFDKYRDKIEENKGEVLVSDYLRSFLFLEYYLATSLKSILDRNDALAYYQNFIDTRTKLTANPELRWADLSKSKEEMQQFTETTHGHDLNYHKINKGKVTYRINRCLWHETTKELDDKEFAYSVCCHYDFEAIKTLNENFILTREKTIMLGNQFCDFCIHDTRVVDEVAHPDSDFWMKLA